MPVPSVGSRAVIAALPTARFYIPELDGLRFFAFLGVFMFHLALRPGIVDAPSPPEGPFLLHGIRVVVLHGWIGVDLFFVLSAFLITELLLREKERFGNIALGGFWTRRILRIWPLYYLAVLLGFMVVPGLTTLGIQPFAGTNAMRELWHRHLVPFALFAGNWSTAVFGYPASPLVSPLWSVSVEEQFYLAWPFVILWTNRTALARLLVMLLGVTAAVRLALALAHVPHPGIYVNTFARLDPIVLGASLSLVWRSEQMRSVLQRWRRLWLLAATTLFCLVCIGPNPLENSVHAVWQFLLIASACAMLVLATISGGWAQRIARLEIIMWLGRISYGLYVYHSFAIGLSDRVLGRPSIAAGGGLGYVAEIVLRGIVAFAFTATLAAVSYYGFERYFLRAKSRFTRVLSRPVT